MTSTSPTRSWRRSAYRTIRRRRSWTRAQASLRDQATLTPLTAVDVANGFPLDSPYNADLPYDIKQKAVFGEASYDFGQFKLTAGGR